MSYKPNKKSKKKSSSSPIVFAMVFIGLIAAVFGLVLICDNKDKESTQIDTEELNLPGYAYTSSISLKAYIYTAKNPEIIEKFPCYCGCGGIGHLSLKNCYITENSEYTDHASYCEICTCEVMAIQRMHEKGMPLKEIREKIDNQYSKFGSPTNTAPITDSL